MITNKYGEQIYNESDIVDLLMSGRKPVELHRMFVDNTVNIENIARLVDEFPAWIPHTFTNDEIMSVADWDSAQQTNWKMPQEYKDLDLAKYVIGLCNNEAELQRVGEELLMYQERGLFDLLRYLKYLVDVMTENRVIWGVGRGSSVASYVLYKLGVHRIDSIFYKLDIKEFLR
jgi:DNA polymerase III alpha subunit